MTVDPTAVPGAVLDALVEPVLMTDAGGRLTFANATALRAFGAGPFLGGPVGALLARFPARAPDGTEQPPALHPIARALAHRQAVIGAEHTYELPHGTVTYLVNAVPLGDAGGAVAVFHDVTEALRLEREGAEHAARLQALVDLVNEAIYIVGRDGRLLFANALGREHMGDPALEPLTAADRARALRITDVE